MTLCVNQVIAWIDEEPEISVPKLERILWIDSTSSQLVTIEMNDSGVMPKLQQYDQILLAIESGNARIVTVEPSEGWLRLEDEIPEEHRRRRDEAWELIKPIVANRDPEMMLSSKRRGKMVAEISKRSGRSKSDLYKFLNRYWKGGGYKNALLPKYSRCGGPGKYRNAESTRSSPKRGTPKKYHGEMGSGEGINITVAIEKLFEKGIKRFYEKPNGGSLSRAFQSIKEEYFNRGYKEKNGALIPILPLTDELPSERQFRYWYERKYRDIRREKIARHGEREYKLLYREILGDSRHMAKGPGSLYQIDATIADVYLVSSLNRSRIIGRPVVYACVDVFSSMITGLSVTLEGPSWVGATLALDNIVNDKVSFCAEYGISIQEEDWPCHHLPYGLLADRGEFEGYQGDNLNESLNIQVYNTPPYRPDWKAFVERQFRTVNDETIHFIPGAVRSQPVRGGKDYRLDAKLTLFECRKLLIIHALAYNKDHHLTSYYKDELQITDNVEAYPLELWKWGVINRAGGLREVENRDQVRLYLLPRKKASVTKRGIYLGQGLYYTCDLAQREHWFDKARERGAWKVDVSYDPRGMDTVFLYHDNHKQMDPCRLLDVSRTLRGRDLYEIDDYSALEKQSSDSVKSRKQQTRAELHAQQEQIIKEATEKTNAALKEAGYQSKSKRTRGIRENRKEEKLLDQEQQGWGLTAPVENENLQLPSEESDDTYVPPLSQIDAIRKSREKKWRKENHNEEE